MQWGNEDGAWMRAVRVAVCLLFVVGPPVAAQPAGSGQPVRFLDRYPASVQQGRVINGVWKRVLPAYRGRYVVALEVTPPKPSLRLSMGLSLKEEQRGTVRFEVVLHRGSANQWTLLHKRELDTTGWVDEEIDLSGTDLSGTELLLLKTLVAGPQEVFEQAVWGEPMLVARQPASANSVILISLDTLRADRVGVYGNTNVSTPTLDALARSGVWYANSYSASTWTFPSHASLLTGLYPTSAPSPDPSMPTPPPSAAQDGLRQGANLANIFRSSGYLTAAFTGGGYMSQVWGFPNGFDTYYMFPQPARMVGCPPNRFDGPPVFDRARRWLQQNAGRPFFLFVHTYDVHDRCEVRPAGTDRVPRWPDPGPLRRQKVMAYYDSLVERADTLVAGIMRELETLGLADRVVVAVTGDHGEAFWEHGEFGHGCDFKPYEELVRVPLIIRPVGQGRRRGRIDAPVSAVDVAPTLLALAGLPRPPFMQGHSLPGLGLEDRPQSAPVFVGCGDNLAVRVGRHKLIASALPDSTEELYDLETDAGERTNLITRDTPDAAQLRAFAREYWQRGSMDGGAQPHQLDEIDDATRERLKALGYQN